MGKENPFGTVSTFFSGLVFDFGGWVCLFGYVLCSM